MAEEHPHVKILAELSKQFQPLFQNSPEGIYISHIPQYKSEGRCIFRFLGYQILAPAQPSKQNDLPGGF